MTAADPLDTLRRHRVVVCVGTGGVGKTTIAAALALMRSNEAMDQQQQGFVT